MVLSGLTALQLKRSLKGTMIATVGFSIMSVVIGIFLSAIYNVATSGVIVFCSGYFSNHCCIPETHVMKGTVTLFFLWALNLL
jgi:ABC-type Mn2+/Zn2+ transport system permease subunit